MRWLLGLNRLPKEIKGKVEKITPNSIHSQGVGHFFARPRFAEALAYNLSPFCYFQELRGPKFNWRFSPAGLTYLLLFGLLGKFAGLPIAFMGTTTSFYTETDGYIFSYTAAGGTWSQARSGGGYTPAVDYPWGAGNFVFAARFNGVSAYTIVREYLSFDTSDIGSASTISAATLKLYGLTQPSLTRYACVTEASQHDTLEAADWTAITDTLLSNTTISNSNWSLSSYNDFGFNASGLGIISKTGLTKMAVRDKTYDVDNVAPTDNGGGGESDFWAYESAQSGTDKDPYISITYAAPITTDNFFQLL